MDEDGTMARVALRTIERDATAGAGAQHATYAYKTHLHAQLRPHIFAFRLTLPQPAALCTYCI